MNPKKALKISFGSVFGNVNTNINIRIRNAAAIPAADNELSKNTRHA